MILEASNCRKKKYNENMIVILLIGPCTLCHLQDCRSRTFSFVCVITSNGVLSKSIDHVWHAQANLRSCERSSRLLMSSRISKGSSDSSFLLGFLSLLFLSESPTFPSILFSLYCLDLMVVIPRKKKNYKDYEE